MFTFFSLLRYVRKLRWRIGIYEQIAATRVQALYRGFSVRRFLETTGDKPLLRARAIGSAGETGSFRPPGLPREKRDKKLPAERVQRDCAFRRRWEREVAIAEMKHLQEESDRQVKRAEED